MSPALEFLKGAKASDQVEVFILGRPHAARILEWPPFDAKGIQLRA
jgi:dimethylglycine dehydrogenase